MNRQIQVLLVDGFNLIRRIYEARGHHEDELDSEVIVAVANSLKRALNSFNPTHACCVLDSHEKTWRHLLYPSYKENRTPTPGPLLDALPLFEAAFLELGLMTITVSGYEADDVIATLARRIGKSGGMVRILSTDKGFLQLIDEQVVIHDHFNNRDLTPEWVLEKYGVTHKQLVDYWALTGDATNNVKGVPRIGPKTAQALITSHGTLSALLQDPPGGTVGERISDHERDAEVCRQLALLKTDVEIGVNLNQLRYRPSPTQEDVSRSN
jgi:protein Xni